MNIHNARCNRICKAIVFIHTWADREVAVDEAVVGEVVVAGACDAECACNDGTREGGCSDSGAIERDGCT